MRSGAETCSNRAVGVAVVVVVVVVVVLAAVPVQVVSIATLGVVVA